MTLFSWSPSSWIFLWYWVSILSPFLLPSPLPFSGALRPLSEDRVLKLMGHLVFFSLMSCWLSCHRLWCFTTFRSRELEVFPLNVNKLEQQTLRRKIRGDWNSIFKRRNGVLFFVCLFPFDPRLNWLPHIFLPQPHLSSLKPRPLVHCLSLSHRNREFSVEKTH